MGRPDHDRRQRYPLLKGIFFVFVGVCFAFYTLHILTTGEAKAGRGRNAPIVTREGNPRAFWSQVGIGGAGAVFGVGVGIWLIGWAED